jgi:predicted phosphodiesterase
VDNLYISVINIDHMAVNKRAEIVKEYIRRYPNHGDQTIGNLVYKDYEHMFNSLKHAYDTVRYYTGKKGKHNRKHVKNTNPDLVRDYSKSTNPFDNIPKSYKAEPEFYDLPSSIREILHLSDIHLPYHDEDALRAAIMKGVTDEVDCIILNGDTMDFHWLSSFDKDPSKPKMREEIEYGRWLMGALRDTFPNAQIYFKIGNHEARLERWLRLKAPEWLGTDQFELKILLEFAKHKIHLIGSNTIIRAGKLFILHGHEYKGTGTVNPARNLFLKAKSSAICGHFHRKSEYLTKDIGEHVHGAWTTGCLCELNPEYIPKGNDWVHGFARISLKADKNFTVKNYTIIKGEVY